MSITRSNQLPLMQIYRMMKLIRRVEERLIDEYHPADQMRCPMHFCVGQESVPAVLAQFMRLNDVLMSHYRSHGYYLGKGGSLNEMVAEFYGKATGANGGVAGSMELGSHEQNFFSGAIVGGSVVIPVGTAFAQKFAGVDDISIAVLGDGSFDEGILYETMNLAALLQLPLLIICENNKYAANTEIAKRLGRPELLPKAEAMGIPGEIVDGYDLDSLFNCVSDAVASVRSGKGPRYIEVLTYRYCAHVGPQPDDYLEYRPSDEIEAWRTKDPLRLLRATLLKNSLTESELNKIDAAIEDEVRVSIEEAKAAAFPLWDWAVGNISANSYSSSATGYFRQMQSTFQSGQNETKLEPF